MPLGPVKSQHVQDRLSLCGVDDLADSQQWFADGDSKQPRASGIGGSGVDLLVGMSQSDPVFAFQESKQRTTLHSGLGEVAKIIG